MHRAAPYVSWRDIEYDNILVAVERKQQAMQNPQSSDPGFWRELGSRNQPGRMHAAALSSDSRILYAGAARGGLWKKALGDDPWFPISDNAYGGAHEIGVIPAADSGPDILIYFFSDWWAYFWDQPEALTLVWRSTDGGETWHMPSGLDRLTGAKRLIVMNDPDHTVFLLARKKGKWQLMVSTDQGESFQFCRYLTSCGDIWTPLTLDGPLYLLDARRIDQTMDGGATWTRKGNLIPATSDTVLLAGSAAQGLHFYAALRREEGDWIFWFSHDGGVSWTKDLNMGSYFDYWQSLGASAVDPMLVAFGEFEFFYARDGGIHWKHIHGPWAFLLNPAGSLHPDINGIYAFPKQDAPSGEHWYIATDGGICASYDQLETVKNLSLNGHGVSQYYSVLTSRRNPDLIVAGSQDQGYQRGKCRTNIPATPGPWVDFKQLIVGDYGRITSTNGSHDLVYSVYPDFSHINIPGYIIVQVGEEDPQIIYLGFGGSLFFPEDETYTWMPYILADPLDPEAFYFCGSKLWRYKRAGAQKWKKSVYSDEDFSPGFLTAIAFSPVDPQRAWVATNDGRLYYSNDGAKTWTQSASIGPFYLYYYGTTLLPSSKDKDFCWVAGSGYSNAPVYCTHDGGITWEPQSDGLPSTLIYCMVEAPDQSGRIFCGSETGAWVFDPATEKWADLLGADAPLITYLACEAVPSRNLVRFATYGRGIWDYNLNTPGYFPYGELRGGANVLELKNHTQPLLGNSTTFLITGCKPAAPGALAFSPGSWERPLLGGTFLVDPQGMGTVFFTASPEGVGSVPFKIPVDPAYMDLEIFFQAGSRDPDQSHDWALSNGLRAVTGR
ncbi:MAG: sialidase family protein [Planctomycetota bacterium]